MGQTICPMPDAKRNARLRLGLMRGNLTVKIAKVSMMIQAISNLFF